MRIVSLVGCGKSGGRISSLSISNRLQVCRVLNSQNALQKRLLSSSTEDKKPSGLMDKVFGLESNTAGPSTNRWSMFIPAFCTHVCLGAPYGWSAISSALTRENGLVASAASDWALDLATYPMSLMIAAGGISAAVFGKWTIKVGVRKAMAFGAGIYGSGFALAALGVMTHNVPVLYAGNLMCGIGYGCAYTPPVQAMIDWFPDRKGLATGLVIAGFGSGALFFTPTMNALMGKFSQLPTYVGQSAEIVLEGGKQFAKIGGELQEVVYATAADLAKLPYDGLAEGFYLVGTGNTGVAASLASIGAIYASIVLASSLMIKRPAAGYLPPGYTPPPTAQGVGANVHVDTLLKTPQFYFLFATSTLLATGGMGLMSVAKPMIQNVFTDSMPALVTTSFASAYLMAMAAGNLAGRLGWAAVSDKIGRRNTFHVFTLGSIPIFASLPYFITQCVTDPNGPLAPMYLAAFCGSTVAAISIMGGVFAVLPPYEADLYGPKYVGAIHGRFLLAATFSTIVGPGILLHLRKIAEADAMKDLLAKVDPAAFIDKFGVDLSHAQTLIEAKTLTITKLMTIMPPGTIDPSPFLYNNTMYTMAGLVSAAAALHFMVRPVNQKYFEKE